MNLPYVRYYHLVLLLPRPPTMVDGCSTFQTNWFSCWPLVVIKKTSLLIEASLRCIHHYSSSRFKIIIVCRHSLLYWDLFCHLKAFQIFFPFSLAYVASTRKGEWGGEGGEKSEAHRVLKWKSPDFISPLTSSPLKLATFHSPDTPWFMLYIWFKHTILV